MSERICPECGKKMKQQFIGLKHCKCGISWLKDVGYFRRTPDMLFCLERVKVGGKVKQMPTVKYNNKKHNEDF